jgi:sortase A
MATTAERGGPADAWSALDRAQQHGAAPGTEVPFLPGIASSPPGGPSRRRWLALAMLCGLVAAWHAGDALYLHAKARLGQVLLQRAWARIEAGAVDAKPWPWADTHPVARLRVPERDVDVMILAGANGRTLAWGPGHADATPRPGADGNAVVTGHRDTHFAFLRDLEPGDRIVVASPNGRVRSYRVERSVVADHRALRLPADDRFTTLALVTCYPFDDVNPATPLRYAVIARSD